MQRGATQLWLHACSLQDCDQPLAAKIDAIRLNVFSPIMHEHVAPENEGEERFIGPLALSEQGYLHFLGLLRL